jgi:hypothetical protein
MFCLLQIKMDDHDDDDKDSGFGVDSNNPMDTTTTSVSNLVDTDVSNTDGSNSDEWDSGKIFFTHRFFPSIMARNGPTKVFSRT